MTYETDQIGQHDASDAVTILVERQPTGPTRSWLPSAGFPSPASCVVIDAPSVVLYPCGMRDHCGNGGRRLSAVSSKRCDRS